jgi:hypothetical protein
VFNFFFHFLFYPKTTTRNTNHDKKKQKSNQTNHARTLKFIVARVAILMYLFGGLGIATKGRKVSRRVAPILVTAPHSSFLDGLIIHVTLCSPLVREEDMNLGSKLIRNNVFLFCFVSIAQSRKLYFNFLRMKTFIKTGHRFELMLETVVVAV